MTEVTIWKEYIVEFVGGGIQRVRVHDEEELDIAISEQFTAYGDCEVDMVYPAEVDIASTKRDY